MSENAVIEAGAIESLPATRPIAMTPMEMVAFAVQSGQSLDTVRELMQLEREWKADKAREAYVAAMAAFKAEPLRINKSKDVKHNGKYMYSHATLAQVVDAVVGALSKHGLSHRWETKQEGETISVTCVLTHELGHSERTTLSGLPDKSGAKNSIQAVGSTVSYLSRYTLMAATGLAASDMDDDGQKAAPRAENITEDQVAELEALLQEVGANRAKFLTWAKVDDLSKIPAKRYSSVVRQLEAKRKAAK